MEKVQKYWKSQIDYIEMQNQLKKKTVIKKSCPS